jgi:glycine cleavage system H protein
MKEIDELSYPGDIRYSKDHEWIKRNGDTARVGISDYAQDQMGDIVFVEMPAVGDVLAKEEAFGTVESVKAVSELFMPVGGKVVAVNTALEDAPELVNTRPYTDGWILEIKPDDAREAESLMDRDAYIGMLKG